MKNTSPYMCRIKMEGGRFIFLVSDGRVWLLMGVVSDVEGVVSDGKMLLVMGVVVNGRVWLVMRCG